MELKKQLEQAVRDEEFNGFERAGFQNDYKLALLAGAAIGYRLAIAHIKKDFDERNLE